MFALFTPEMLLGPHDTSHDTSPREGTTRVSIDFRAWILDPEPPGAKLIEKSREIGERMSREQEERFLAAIGST